MIRLVAFDYNGTLIADIKPILEGVNRVLKAYGKKPITHKQFLNDFDIPISIAYKNHGLDLDLYKNSHQKVTQIFHPFYEKRAAKIRTRANARKVLEYLKQKDIVSILFSNHTQEGVSRQLIRLCLVPFFEAFLTNTERHHALSQKAKGDRLKDYLSAKKIRAEEVLIVGDTIEEIQIAKSLGSIVCSITHGNCSTSRLKAAKPDYLINNLEEIVSIVNKLNH